MTVDEIGNIYIVRKDNSLVRFTPAGDSSAFFRTVQNGDIGQVDATNPLRVIVYYPSYSRIVLLDRMLSRKNELDLRRINSVSVAAVASSADGNLWVYDRFNARLRKLSEQLQQVAESNDLRQESHQVPVASFLAERDWKVFLCDTAKGIYTFDRYGNYLNTLAIFGVKKLQVINNQLVYRQADTLFSWDMNKAMSRALLLPGAEVGIVDAAIARDLLYVLYADRLSIFRIDGAGQ
ncbi:MAG: hypothetical protein EOP49_42700 [Sphingobacteriales bacterium]|nr:MAG: hypothetical protein EOP49_42700 [Sphingobacteriales bacterium]